MIPIQPWMIKGGAVVLFLSAIFVGGCQAQKNIDAKKIDRLRADYTRAVEIIEVFQDNYDTLDKALKDQNAEIKKLGKETERKINSINAAHRAAITQLNSANTAAVRSAEKEAAELRERMVGLSAAEACHAAWEEVANETP